MNEGSNGKGLTGERGSTQARGGDIDLKRCAGMPLGGLKHRLCVVEVIAVRSEVERRVVLRQRTQVGVSIRDSSGAVSRKIVLR